MTRHWYLDWAGPRPERDLVAAQEAVLRDQEAHDRLLAADTETAVDGAEATAELQRQLDPAE